jgi:hypothetical protein
MRDQPVIGCLPTQAGFYNFSVGVQDANNVTTNATTGIQVIFDFTVVAPGQAVVGRPMVISVRTGESFGTLTYNYTGLPSGCRSVDSSQLNCSPTAAGTYNDYVSVHDQLGEHGVHHVQIEVVPPSPVSPLTTPILGGLVVIGGLTVGIMIWVLRRPPKVQPTL